MSRRKVAVVFGGRSVEHDVSIVTAHQAMEALASRFDLVPIYVTRAGEWLTADGLFDLDVYRSERWKQVGEPCYIPPVPGSGVVLSAARLRRPRALPVDVVVPAVHGTFGEDGTLQGLFDLADVPYTGSKVAASAIGLDKAAMKAALKAAGLPVVDDVLVEADQLERDPDAVLETVASSIGFPCFAKPSRAGSSVGIRRANDAAELRDALEVARRYDRRILVERAMTNCIEINCSVLGGGGRAPQVSVCEQPVAWEEFLTFEDKYMRGSKDRGAKTGGMASQDRRIPAPISEAATKQIQDNAIRAFKAIDASGVARIDAFLDEDTGETWVMEINTMPGSFAFYLWEATGKSFQALMDDLIQIALDEHKQRSELLFTFESGMLQNMGGSKTEVTGDG